MLQTFICGECDLPNTSSYRLPGDTALCAACKAMPGWFLHPAVQRRVEAERQAACGPEPGQRVKVKSWTWDSGEFEIIGQLMQLRDGVAIVRVNADCIVSVPTAYCLLEEGISA